MLPVTPVSVRTLPLDRSTVALVPVNELGPMTVMPD